MSVRLSQFGSISLDDLVAQAGLMTRIDRKYIVPSSALDALLAALEGETRVLQIDGARTFSYESVYFDTPDLLSFHMAAHPRRRRFKLRTRGYLDSDTCFLEIKTRGARGATVKDRSPHDPAHPDQLSAEALNDVADAFAAIGVAEDRVHELAPTLTTRYQRTTLLSNGGRATIDSDLSWESPHGPGFSLPHLAIVETKSPSTASPTDRLLWRYGFRPATVSKYASGLAALNPQLPRNRWSRVLRGPFSTTSPTTSLQPHL